MPNNAILNAIFLGLLASASPCVLPLYPGYLAYLGSQGEKGLSSSKQYLSGFFVFLGVIVMMLALGALIAALSVSIGHVLIWVVPAADIIILGLGIMMLFDINPFRSLPAARSPIFKNPLASAFFYGLLYGPLTLPCSGPLVVGIFAYSLTVSEALDKLFVFLTFGLGFGLPLFFLSLLSGVTQRWLVRFFAYHSRIINVIGGLLLIGVAVFDFVNNWPSIMLFFR